MLKRIFYVVFISTTLFGSEYHVAKTGSDESGDGSAELPWNSITFGLSLISGGDTITIHSGLYDEYGIEFKKSGYNAEQPTLIRGEAGSELSTVIEHFLSLNDREAILEVDGSFIKIQNLILRGGGGVETGALRVGNRGADHIIVENCELYSDGKEGNTSNNPSVVVFNGASDCTIRNCKVYSNGSDNNSRSGIKIWRFAYNFVAENNVVYGLKGKGIDNKHGLEDQTIIVKNNFIYDCGQAGINLNAGYSQIKNNIIINCGGIVHQGAIIVYTDGGAPGGSNSEISNNTIYSCSPGIELAPYGEQELFNLKITGNIIFNSQYQGSPELSISTYGQPYQHNHKSDYNLIFNDGTDKVIRQFDDTGYDLQEWNVQFNQDTNSIQSKPLFTNSSGSMNEINDFLLVDNSPGKNASQNGADMGANVALVGIRRSLTADTNSIIFSDDFEIDRTSSYGEYNSSNGNFIREAGIGYNGSYGMHAHWNAGVVDVGSLHLGFGRNPVSSFSNRIHVSEDFREIYVRFYMRTSAGWIGNPAKVSRATIFSSSNWSQAMIAHLWGGNNNTLMLDPVSCVGDDNLVKSVGYNDFSHMQWLGQIHGTTHVYATENSDKWYCIEYHVKLNNPGENNGVFEFWIDGVWEAGRTNLNFVKGYTDYAINAVFLENYWNSGAVQSEDRYFDNFVVSTKPIGPLSNINNIDNQSIPSDFILSQNYPNPFNPTTVISYKLKVRSEVVLKIYDILGREITVLVKEEKNAGNYSVEWNGTNSAGQLVGSGVYFYQLETNTGLLVSKKMILVK